MDKKQAKAYKKLNAEDLEGLLHMRKRGYTAKNKKAYSRKKKHKAKEEE